MLTPPPTTVLEASGGAAAKALAAAVDHSLNTFLEQPTAHGCGWRNQRAATGPCPGYAALHNMTLPYDGEVGDKIGLFPCVYVARFLRSGSARDIEVARAIAAHYVAGFPLFLNDTARTFARSGGWPGQRGDGPSFLWADDQVRAAHTSGRCGRLAPTYQPRRQYMGMTLLARLAALDKNKPYADRVAAMQLSFAEYMRGADGIYFHGCAAVFCLVADARCKLQPLAHAQLAHQIQSREQCHVVLQVGPRQRVGHDESRGGSPCARSGLS